MIPQNLEHPIAPEFDSSRLKLRFQEAIEFPRPEPRLNLSLPLYHLNDQTCIYFSPLPRCSLLVVVLPDHANLKTEPFDTYSSVTSYFLVGLVRAVPSCFFLNSSAFVPVRSHRIPKNA